MRAATAPAPYARDPDFQRGLAIAAAHGGEHDVDRLLRSTAVLLLPPLCISTGRVPTALSWLDRNGFQVVHTGVERLSPQQVARIWRYQIHAHDPARVRVVADLLTCGPALVLGVVGSPTRHASVAARLKERKGPADPHRAEPHHLRTVLGAANLLNNLAHTPDGPAETVREAAAMLGDTGAAALWAAAGAALAGGRPPSVDVPCLPPPTAVRGGISLAHVGVALRLRLLEEIHAELGTAGTGLHGVRSVLHHEQEWAEQRDPTAPLAALDGFRRRFRPLCSNVERITHSQRLRGISRVTDLITLFGDIEGALFGLAFDLERETTAAARSGVPMAARDRLILATEWACRRIPAAQQTGGR